ncbi:MAG TPA: TetR/AcrR family transcriptional regulator [Candidatus Anoxymicrobiaceae bacterium]|jgi:AcrR family transcriptional regulator
MAQRKKRIPKEQRRTQILNAAVSVFAEKGYRKASITEINDKARIARGTFYLYFESKQDIFLELVESYFDGYARILDENHARLEKALGNGTDPLVAQRQNAFDIFHYHASHPALTDIVYREGIGRDEDFTARVSELAGLARAQLTEGFRLMASKGMIRECDIELVTSMTMGAVMSITSEHILGEKRKDIKNVADEFVDMMIRALAPPGLNSEKAIELSKQRRDDEKLRARASA